MTCSGIRIVEKTSEMDLSVDIHGDDADLNGDTPHEADAISPSGRETPECSTTSSVAGSSVTVAVVPDDSESFSAAPHQPTQRQNLHATPANPSPNPTNSASATATATKANPSAGVGDNGGGHVNASTTNSRQLADPMREISGSKHRALYSIPSVGLAGGSESDTSGNAHPAGSTHPAGSAHPASSAHPAGSTNGGAATVSGAGAGEVGGPSAPAPRRARTQRFGLEIEHEEELDELLGESLDVWGLDVFRVEELSSGHPLVTIVYSIFEVSPDFEGHPHLLADITMYLLYLTQT